MAHWSALALLLFFGVLTSPARAYVPRISADGCDASQTALITAKAAEACQCLRKTFAKTAFEWRRLVESWGPIKQNPTFSQIILLPGNREYYQTRLKAAIKACDAYIGLQFSCKGDCPEAPNERVAYVKVWFGQSVNPIYTCPRFFDKNTDSRDVIIHELGRLYGNIDGEVKLDRDNIYVWDKIVQRGCRDFD